MHFKFFDRLWLMSTRWRARWRIFRNHGKALNRRVDVENVLISVAQGKRDLLTREECQQLANKLGMTD